MVKSKGCRGQIEDFTNFSPIMAEGLSQSNRRLFNSALSWPNCRVYRCRIENFRLRIITTELERSLQPNGRPHELLPYRGWIRDIVRVELKTSQWLNQRLFNLASLWTNQRGSNDRNEDSPTLHPHDRIAKVVAVKSKRSSRPNRILLTWRHHSQIGEVIEVESKTS